MATLVPVDFDPFAAAASPAADGVLRLTIQKQPKLVPVDHDPFAPKMGVGEDVLRSVGAGLVKGTAAVAGLPDAVDRFTNWLAEQGVGRATSAIKSGGVDWSMPERTPAQEAAVTAREESRAVSFPSTETVQSNIESVTGPVHEPQTKWGEYARGAAEFVPGTLMAPGGGMVSNAIRYGVVPGLASEAAGQATKGTAYEPYARVGGALAGAGASAVLSRPGTAAKAIRAQLPEGVTPQMVDQAGALIDRAAQQGIALAWPEALSQVAGRPVLTNVMRHLEAAPQTEATMAEFFGQRAQQVESAGRQAMGRIAPPNHAPSSIGPAVGQAAEGVVNDVRGAINRASDPLYKAAEAARLSPQEMARVTAHPGWPEARNAVRSDPQLNRYVAHLPDDSVGFLNEVKKYLDAAAENAGAPVNVQRNMQRAAGYGRDAEAVRDAARRASPQYGQALDLQARAREQFLQPLLNGPIGRLAKHDLSTKKAIDALFPANPLPNSAQEIGQTVGQLAQRSPRVASDLVRAHVESVFNETTQALQSGANQAGGAKFASVLTGNPQQRANLEAAIKALPNGAERLAGFNRFLEVVQATGTRQNVGSRTAYNAEMLRDQAASGLLGEGSKALANPLKGAQFLADKYERWKLGRNLNELATILTSPQSANQLRAIARMPAGSRRAEAAALRIVNLTRVPLADDPVAKAN